MIDKFNSNLKKKICLGGFTLTELLAYVTISSVLLTGIGIVLNNIVRESSENQKETLREQEINKALDLIAQEVRTAEEISTNPTRPSQLDKLSNTFPDKVSKSKPILVVKGSNLSSPIVYEIANLKDSTVWQGPMAIYRWGPSIKSSGNYANPGSPSKWQSNILIDSIESKVAEDATRPDYCRNIINPMNPYDEIVQIPAKDPKGFYICVPNDTDGATASKMAQVVIRGRITDYANNSKKPYQAQQKVSTRQENCELF